MNDTCRKTESSYQRSFEAIINRIDDEQKPLSNRELLTICREATDFLRDGANPHLCHEIAETALNLLIKKKYAKSLLAAENPAEAMRDILKPLAARLPTETWRSREQNIWQQFSTPPGIAYLSVYLLNLQNGEQVTAEEIIRSVREENGNVELLGDIKIRKTRFQGRSVIEVTPSTYEQIRELRETGLINIIQNSKQRFFVSEDENTAQAALAKILKLYPPLHLLENETANDCLPNALPLADDKNELARLPAWLIEPPLEEIRKIAFAE